MFRNTIQKGIETAEAIISTGVIIHVNINTFLDILKKTQKPILVHTKSSALFDKKHQYMTVYRDFYFYTESNTPLSIPEDIELEIINSERMWVPKL